MTGPIQTSLIPLTLFKAFDTLTALFRGSEVRPALIVPSPQGLALQIADTKVPLPQSVNLPAGQAVEVSLVETEDGQTLQIIPKANPVPPAPRPATEGAGRFIEPLLRALGMLTPKNTTAAQAILPRGLPLTEPAVRHLLTVFVARADVGRVLQDLAALLPRAVDAGALPPEIAKEAEQLAVQMKAADAASFRQALSAARTTTGRSLESMLAELMQRERNQPGLRRVRSDLLLRLSALKNDETFARFLRVTGEQRTFLEAADTLTEFARGTHIQNTRAPEVPYQFVGIPLHPDTGFDRAQVHFFGEGQSGREGDRGDAATVIFDLSMSRLGEMWIVLGTTEHGCTCTLNAANAEAVPMLEARVGDLEASLQEVGFENATVEIREWDGERLEAVADVMQNLNGLDLQA